MKYYTCCRETGDVIDVFNTYEEALHAVEEYEIADREEKTYTPDFYEIIEKEGKGYVFE